MLAACAAAVLVGAALASGRSGDEAPARAVTAAPAVAPGAPLEIPGGRLVGEGPSSAWVFAPDGAPERVVVLLHGMGDVEPTTMRPWIDHLTAQGAAVVFPRWQESLATNPATYLDRALAGAASGLDALGRPAAPLAVVGYSAGGMLAAGLAARATDAGLGRPAAVASVFPGRRYTALPEVAFPLDAELGALDPATPVLVLHGDRDEVVGRLGADELAEAWAGRAATRVVEVRSGSGFVADHGAPQRGDAASRRAIWAPVDELLGAVSAGAAASP